MAKLVTLESLENKNLLCLDNFCFTNVATEKGPNTGTYSEVANVTLPNNVWGETRLCFFAMNSAGSMGIYMLSARHNGTITGWQDIKYIVYGDSFRTSMNVGRLRCFYNSSTRKFSFWTYDDDWNFTKIKQIYSPSKEESLVILTGPKDNYSSIPTSAGTEIECQVAATNVDIQNYVESRVVKATTSNINDLRGGVRKLANFFSLFPKLKRGVNYGN